MDIYFGLIFCIADILGVLGCRVVLDGKYN
jgi:hypothetical protein